MNDQKQSEQQIDIIEKQKIELYKKVGLIVHISQMIEYNLANIIAFDEMLKPFDEKKSYWDIEVAVFHQNADDLYDKICNKPLGSFLLETEKKDLFPKIFLDKLNSVREKRNYVMHKMFKEDLLAHHIDKDPGYYFEEIDILIDDMIYVNDVLVCKFRKQKEEFKYIY